MWLTRLNTRTSLSPIPFVCVMQYKNEPYKSLSAWSETVDGSLPGYGVIILHNITLVEESYLNISLAYDCL